MLQGRCHDGSPRGLRIAALALAAFALLLSAVTNVFAQTDQLAVSIDGFAAQNWSSGQAIVSVIGADGKPASGLTKEDFQAQVNGSDASVTLVSRGVDSNVPISVVLAFDVSAGMQGAALDQAKVAAHRFLDGLGTNDTVAVLTFADSVNIVQPFTNDRAVAGAAIDGLVAGGSSSLYAGTTTSVLQAAASANTGRRAIVLLSGSADTGTTGSRQQSLVAAKGLGVPAYVIGLGSTVDQQYLRDLTAAGGGQMMRTATPEGLPQLYQNVSDLIRDQYVLTIDASSLGLSTTDASTLHVAVTSGSATGSGERLVCPAKVCASFHGLAASAQLKGAQTVVADVLSSDKVTSVSLLIDGSSVQTVTDVPYQFSIDANAFDKGNHTIALAVKTSAGTTKLGQLSVQFSKTGGGIGVSLIVIAALVLMSVVAVIAVFYAFRRRRGVSGSPQPVGPAPEPSEPGPISIRRRRHGLFAQDDDDTPPLAPAEAEPVLGFISSTGGPLAGQVFSVGAKPVSIGSGHRCGIQLPLEVDGVEVPSEYIRVWIRGEQLMVHEVRRLTAMGSVGGQWEILGDRDTFTIGSLVFKFNLEEPVEAPEEPVPNVLRDNPSPLTASAPTSDTSPWLTASPLAMSAAEAAAPAPAIPMPAPPVVEAVPNILRDRSEETLAAVDDEPSEQAAGG